MRLIGLCLIFVCFNISAKSQTLLEWISYFKQNNIQIIYSSDFLKNTDLSTILDSGESITSLNQSLSSIALTLIEVDEFTYVINPIEKSTSSNTGLIIKLVGSDSKSLTVFSVNDVFTSTGLVVLDKLHINSLDLEITAQGYIPLNQTVMLNKGKYKSVSYSLEPEPVRIDKIIVTASKVNFKPSNVSKKTFLRDDIENTVTLGNDPVRATQNIAGNTSSGLSGKTRTRGGNENESLIVLDNHVLRNPFHFKNFFSLFSTINLSTVDGLDFYSGVFPIQYGGRLSAVLDVQTGENYNQPTHEVGFNLINAYYTYRHSSDDYNQQFLTSIRTGGKLVNEHFVKDSIIQPEFDDAYFKATQELNDNWYTSQHLLLSRDEITINDVKSEDSNEVAKAGHHDQDFWTQVHYDNHQNMYANLQFYISRKHNTRVGSIVNENSQATLSEDILTKYYGLKYNQTINVRDEISLNFGLDIRQEETSIDSSKSIKHLGNLVSQLGLERDTQEPFFFENQGLSFDTFINARYQFNDKLFFDLGLRFEKKQWIDRNVISPRFNLSYFHNDSTTLRFALGRHQQSQYIDELLLEDEDPQYFNPTSADIAIFELNKSFSSNLNLRAEVYYKKYSSTQPYYENLFNGLHILPDLYYDRIRVTPDDSQATGAEVTLYGNNHYFDWSASYILSDVIDLIEEVEVPRSWDQHNALKFNLHMPINIKIMNNWYLDLTANYHNGWGKTDIIETNGSFDVGSRNANTFDDFYQFNIKFSKQYVLQKGLLDFSIQASNLFQRDNPCCVNYELENGILQSEEKNWLPTIPNLSVVYKWD